MRRPHRRLPPLQQDPEAPPCGQRCYRAADPAAPPLGPPLAAVAAAAVAGADGGAKWRRRRGKSKRRKLTGGQAAGTTSDSGEERCPALSYKMTAVAKVYSLLSCWSDGLPMRMAVYEQQVREPCTFGLAC